MRGLISPLGSNAGTLKQLCAHLSLLCWPQMIVTIPMHTWIHLRPGSRSPASIVELPPLPIELDIADVAVGGEGQRSDVLLGCGACRLVPSRGAGLIGVLHTLIGRRFRGKIIRYSL